MGHGDPAVRRCVQRDHQRPERARLRHVRRLARREERLELVDRAGRRHGGGRRRCRTPTARSPRRSPSAARPSRTPRTNSLYNNGSIFGANDWTWRQESGDWRFFYFNVANAVPDGTLFLTDTTWDDPTVTDLDTLLFGPTVDPIDAPVIFGPGGIATIDTIGRSQNAYLGSGTWAFNTSTGHNEEIVAAPASQGMHAVVQHGVGYNGDMFNVPFSTTMGSLAVNPTSVTSDAADDGTGSFDVTVKSSLDLTGLQADAFGSASRSRRSCTRLRTTRRSGPEHRECEGDGHRDRGSRLACDLHAA